MNADTVNQQVQELEKLRRQARRTSLAIVVSVSTIVIVGVGAIIGSVHSLATAGPKQDEFIKQLGSRVQAEVLPTVKHVVEALALAPRAVRRDGVATRQRASPAGGQCRDARVEPAWREPHGTVHHHPPTGPVGRELEKREARLKKTVSGRLRSVADLHPGAKHPGRIAGADGPDQR